MDGTKQVAQRIVNAELRDIANVIEIIGCTQAEAEQILTLYRKYRVTKLDAMGGVISLKHGGLWDAEVLRRALAQCN